MACFLITAILLPLDPPLFFLNTIESVISVTHLLPRQSKCAVGCQYTDKQEAADVRS